MEDRDWVFMGILKVEAWFSRGKSHFMLLETRNQRDGAETFCPAPLVSPQRGGCAERYSVS